MRNKEMRKDEHNSDNRTDKCYRRRKNTRCDICPPNRGENTKSHKKYGETKPKRKTDKRKGLI